ncbi:VPS10 domain-containing protein [Paenibacillus sp. SN-8-1]|uniref:WD40/YVTN/BNR-like repeat-containing protein n=1 Tax=Paenibacillus sp. SN-8-1 TaxID=3435409 RepID=UPI003D9A3493
MKLNLKWMYMLLTLSMAVTAAGCSGAGDSNNGVSTTAQNTKSNQGTGAAGQRSGQSTGQGAGDVKQSPEQSTDQGTGESSSESGGNKTTAADHPSAKGAKSAQIQALLTGFKLVGDRTVFTWGKAAKGSLRVYRSDDAGKTWTDISPTPAIAAMDMDNSTFTASDERHLLLLPSQNDGTRKVVYSKDGGKTWSSGPSLPYAINAETAFISSTQGYLLIESDAAMGHSGKAFYKTANGGATWKKVMDNSEASLSKEEEAKKGLMPQYGFTGYGVSFRDAKNGWAPMQSREGTPHLVRTRDGGVTWKLVDLSQKANWNGNPQITAAPEFFGTNRLQGWMPLSIHKNNAYDVGGFRTTDGGESWAYIPFEQNIPESSNAMDSGPVFVSPDQGWFWNGTELKATVNGGKSWQVLKVNSEFTKSLASFPEMMDLQFTDARHGWMLLASAGREHSRLLKTEDGGTTWVII